jgi:hypothetical protein
VADYRDDPRWKEYGFDRGMFPTVASSEYTTISHPETEPRYADTLSPEDLAEIMEGSEFGKSDRTERPGDIGKFLKDAKSEAEVRRAWEDWADYGSPTDGSSDTIVVDTTTGVDVLHDGSIPIMDMIGPGASGTFGDKMSAEAPASSYGLYGSRPPPEPFETEGFMEMFNRRHPDRLARIAEYGTQFMFGEEDGRLAVVGPDGYVNSPEAAENMWTHWKDRHDAGQKRQTDDRNAVISKYWEGVDARTKQIEDYIKSSGITAEEYSKRSTAAKLLDPEYVKSHPDYEELVREALPTPDERLEVVSPSFLDSIISPASADSSFIGGGMSGEDKWKAGMLGGYEDEYKAAADKDFEDYPSDILRAAGIGVDTSERGIAIPPPRLLGEMSPGERFEKGVGSLTIPGDWESIRPDEDFYFRRADTKVGDPVLGGDPYYGRSPALLGRTPPVPGPSAPKMPFGIPGLGLDSLDALPVTPSTYSESFPAPSDLYPPVPTPPSWLPKGGIIGSDLLDSSRPYGYTPPRTTPTAPVAPSWFPSLETDLLDSARSYGHVPRETTPMPPSWFPLLETDSLDSASSFHPPGYSPITGTFYPTAAEIMAAGGTTP